MKTLAAFASLALSIVVAGAALNTQQTAARKLPTEELVRIIQDAAKQDRELRLTVSEIERIIGSPDSVKKSKRWNDADEYVFKLSGGRWLEVTKAQKSIYEAMLVDGKKRWLVWK